MDNQNVLEGNTSPLKATARNVVIIQYQLLTESPVKMSAQRGKIQTEMVPVLTLQMTIRAQSSRECKLTVSADQMTARIMRRRYTLVNVLNVQKVQEHMESRDNCAEQTHVGHYRRFFQMENANNAPYTVIAQMINAHVSLISAKPDNTSLHLGIAKTAQYSRKCLLQFRSYVSQKLVLEQMSSSMSMATALTLKKSKQDTLTDPNKLLILMKKDRTLLHVQETCSKTIKMWRSIRAKLQS